MAGLLDLFGSTDDAQRAGLLMLAAAGPRAQPASFGQRLLESVQQFDAQKQAQKDRAAQEEERKQRAAMQAMQMQQMQQSMGIQADTMAERQAARDQSATDARLLRDSFRELPGPTMDGGALMGRFDPRLMLGAGGSPQAVQQAMGLNAAMNPAPKDQVLSPGQQVFRDGKPLYGVPDKQPEPPTSVREYKFGQQDPAFDAWLLRGKQATAPRVDIRNDIKTGESLAGQVGKIVSGTRDQAMAGLKLVDTAQRVNEALDAKAGVYAGPLANARLQLAQVGDALGIAGKDTAEKIVNTRNTIRGMAEQAVAARSQLGGQAQISNTEQELLNKATSGDISDMTVPELRAIAGLNDRLGRQLYGLHDSQMKTLGGRADLQQLAPFYAVPGLPAPRGNIDDLVNKYRSR